MLRITPEAEHPWHPSLPDQEDAMLLDLELRYKISPNVNKL
jgi:hypothetical protein